MKGWMTDMMVCLVGIGVLVTSNPTAANAYDPGNIVDEVQAMVARSWPLAPDIWPGADFDAQSAVLLFENRAVEVTTDGQRELDRSVIDPLAPGFPDWVFFFADVAGRRAVVIQLDAAVSGPPSPIFPGDTEPARRIFRLATHEKFHDFQMRSRWVAPRANGFAEYPVTASWSRQRAHLYDAMHRALAQPAEQSQHLRHASRWYQAFADVHGSVTEMTSQEIIEGMAQYAELQLLAAADIADPTDRDARIRQSLRYVFPWHAGLQPNFTRGHGYQTYLLGSLAGALLETTQQHWQMDVAAGRSPLDMLLALYPVTGDIDPVPEIDASNQALVEVLNSERGAHLQPLLDLYMGSSAARLLIPSPYRLVADPRLVEAVEEARKETNPHLTGEFRGEGVPPMTGSIVGGYIVGDGYLLVRNRAMVGGATDGVFTIVLQPEEFLLDGTRLLLASDSLEGEFTVNVSVDTEGRWVLEPISASDVGGPGG